MCVLWDRKRKASSKITENNDVGVLAPTLCSRIGSILVLKSWDADGMEEEVKFDIGDTTDTNLCVALKHEYLRCEEAFDDFTTSATLMIALGENRKIAYKTYNAYARFIHHLYEFMLGAISRERGDTRPLSSHDADRYMGSHLQRVLTNRREDILNGTAPTWENDISAFPEKIPEDLPAEFRRLRNTVTGHVKHERSTLNMSSFYDRNHKFVYMLFSHIKNWWGRMGEEFPDLKEITAFSVLIQEQGPSFVLTSPA